MSQLCLLTLASGRSGTSFLYAFFRRHVHHCRSSHEPYLAAGNPTLFGPAIYWNATGNDEPLQALIEQKRRYIADIAQPVYLESNHALLKSAHRHLHRLSDNIGLIRLHRHPLKIAKSEYLREQLIQRCRIPLRHYTLQGQTYFRWSLTGQEPVFRHFAGQPLSRYQFYVLQWLEIERRADTVIADNRWQHRVCSINMDNTGQQLQQLTAMLDFFQLEARQPFNLNLYRNKTPFVGNSAALNRNDYAQAEALLPYLPDSDRQRLLPYLQVS